MSTAGPAAGFCYYTNEWWAHDEDPGPGPYVVLVTELRPEKQKVTVRFLYRCVCARACTPCDAG